MNPDERGPRGRYLELDGLRGIAVLLVVASHYTVRFSQIWPEPEPFPVGIPWGGLGVELFFMISGFVILMSTKRHHEPKDFALARAVRLYPTYWVCIALTLAVELVGRVDVLLVSGKELAINLTMLQSFVGVQAVDGAYWSLSRELIFYGIIFIALSVFAERVPLRFVLWLSVVWPLAGLAICLIDAHFAATWSHLLVTATVGQYAALFCIGMLMYLWREGVHRSRLLVPLVLVAAAAHWVMRPDLSSGWRVGETLIVAAMGLGFILLTSRPGARVLRLRPLVWVGAISYPLYLLHQNIGYVLLLRTTEAMGPLASRALALAAALFLAWAVHELVEVRVSRRINRAIRGSRARSTGA